jgi:hypothetical protein
MTMVTGDEGRYASLGMLEESSPRLTNVRGADGWREFAVLPATQDFPSVRAHLLMLSGLSATRENYLSITNEGFIDFAYQGHAFSVLLDADYSLWVNDPACPDAVLLRVLDHCAALLGRERHPA